MKNKRFQPLKELIAEDLECSTIPSGIADEPSSPEETEVKLLVQHTSEEPDSGILNEDIPVDDAVFEEMIELTNEMTMQDSGYFREEVINPNVEEVVEAEIVPIIKSNDEKKMVYSQPDFEDEDEITPRYDENSMMSKLIAEEEVRAPPMITRSSGSKF